MRLQGVATNAHRHHDLLEGGITGPLADAVHGALELVHARVERGQRVGDRKPEVVMTVGRQLNVLELRAKHP